MSIRGLPTSTLWWGRLGRSRAARACYQLSRRWRWEPIFLSSRNEERRIWSIFERRVTTKWGKLAPAPGGCGANRSILRCRPRLWARHSLRTPPPTPSTNCGRWGPRSRLDRFSSATPPAGKLIAGSRQPSAPHSRRCAHGEFQAGSGETRNESVHRVTACCAIEKLLPAKRSRKCILFLLTIHNRLVMGCA